MTVRLVPFDALPGFSPFFRAYVAGDARLAPFFEHPDWNSDAAFEAAAMLWDQFRSRPVCVSASAFT